nr:hypothetical protein [uncultured Draconibacterium sp.]
MNVAFVTIFLLFISLPGFALRRSYFASRFSINQFSTNIVNEIFWSFIPALILHVIAIWIVERYSNKEIYFEYIGYLATGGNDKEYINAIFTNIHQHLKEILLYNVVLLFFAFILGTTLRKIVRILNLDVYTRILSFPNKWHYIFTGEYMNRDYGWKYHKNIDFIFVDILMDVGGEAVLYSGKFEEYFLSKVDNGLDRIMIKYPSKKIFSIDNHDEPEDIPSDLLTIPYKNILNLNISYYKLGDDGTIEELGNDDYIEPNPAIDEQLTY